MKQKYLHNLKLPKQ